jgi:hypothetical protein
MKTFLTRINGIYTLMKDGKMIASDDIDFQKDYELQKLSIENCNLIFGIFDVEKLAHEFSHNLRGRSVYAIIGFDAGFNKALELNKAKEFTLEQVIEAMSLYKRNEFAMSKVLSMVLEQPKEVAVEIEMESMNIDEIREQGKGFLNGNTMKPKLDENGCLILKITD